MSPTYREGSPLSAKSLLQTAQVLIAPVGALPSTAQRFFIIILFFPPFRLNGSQMKSGGAIGLITGIRPKSEGAAVCWHTDQQRRQEQESGQSSMQPPVL